MYLIFLLGGYRAGGKGVCGRLISPAHETQSMREIRLLRGRLPWKGGGLTGMLRKDGSVFISLRKLRWRGDKKLSVYSYLEHLFLMFVDTIVLILDIRKRNEFAPDEDSIDWCEGSKPNYSFTWVSINHSPESLVHCYQQMFRLLGLCIRGDFNRHISIVIYKTVIYKTMSCSCSQFEFPITTKKTYHYFS